MLQRRVGMSRRKQSRPFCRMCGKETPRRKSVYCTNACQLEYEYQYKILEWLSGERLGLRVDGTVCSYVKRYLRIKFNNQCCLCGWSKVNPKTNRVPLVADHIDGNWRNNIESNLRLICPNCDALSPTYCGLNRGKGRSYRRDVTVA